MTKLPPCCLESVTAVLFNDSLVLLKIPSGRSVFLITPIVSILSSGKKTWQHFKAQERSKQNFVFPTLALLMSDFYLKSQDVKAKVLLLGDVETEAQRREGTDAEIVDTEIVGKSKAGTQVS